MLVLSLPSPAPPVSANALHLETTGNGTAPARQRLACTRARKLSWLEHGRCSPTSLSRNGALCLCPQAGRPGRAIVCWLPLRKRKRKFLQGPPGRCGVRRAGKEKKKKTRNHVEHVSSPVVSYTVATLKAKNAIRARRMLARFFFNQRASLTALGRPLEDTCKFITEDEDRLE